MIRPDFAKRHQTAEDMRRLSIEAEHIRSRERFQALYMIGSEQDTATGWAQEIKRHKQTVLEWVHCYNEAGPAGISYQHTGGRRPKLSEAEKKRS